jgi:RNA polymerase sigma-70 factor (ECF subfamily)
VSGEAENLPTPENAPPIEQLIEAARGGSREALGFLLERYRPYLLAIAQSELRPDLRVKVAPSDLVQGVFLSAQTGFADFRGQTEGELQGWLRVILLNNLANIARSYRATDERQIDREIPADAKRLDGDLYRHLRRQLKTQYRPWPWLPRLRIVAPQGALQEG